MRHQPLNQVILSISILLMLFLFSCSKEDRPPVENGNSMLETKDGFSEEELDTYQGDIGLIFSTRDVARKGYNPHRIELTVGTSNGKFDRSLILDEISKMNQICPRFGETLNMQSQMAHQVAYQAV